MDKDKTFPASPLEQGTRVMAPDGGMSITVRLKRLNTSQLQAIDRALEEIGDYGEVHLIVNRGHLRYIGKFKTETLDAET